ncbi:MAG: cytochrome P450 [Polyangiaceae bacterium]|nr:cytochrome P450 [Polyangiaceae bacterium]
MSRPLTSVPLLTGATLAGHAAEFRQDRIGLARRLAREERELSRIRIVNLPVICVSGPEAAREILVEKWRSFTKTVGIRTILFALTGEGLFTAEGELWKRQRRLMAPLFQPSFVEAYVPGVVECVERWIERRRDGEVIDVGQEMTRVTMNVVARALFDADTDGEARELGEALEVVLEDVARQAATVGLILKMQAAGALEGLEGRLPPALEGARARLLHGVRHPLPLPTARSRRLRGALATLGRLVDRMIEERRRAGLAREDVMTKLLAARDEDGGGTMSDQQVRDEVLTLFFAGHETTAVALTWAFFLLSRHPGAAARLEEEAAALPRGALAAASLPGLGYTLRLLKETLRLYPPAHMFDRIAIEDVEIQGALIPRGTNVFLFPSALHMRADLWPDPERFDPDRFLPEVEAARPRLAYLPFGAGPRVCIGMHFALMEGQLALASIARRMRLTPLPGQDVRPGGLATLRPAEPLLARVSLRAPGGPEPIDRAGRGA